MKYPFSQLRSWLSSGPSNDKHNRGEDSTDLNDVSSADAIIWKFIVLVGLIIVTTVFITFGNVPRLSAFLLALLAIGVGQALLLPLRFSFMGAILMIVTWVLLRIITGVWIEGERLQSIVELGLLIVTLLPAFRLHQLLARQAKELASLRSLRNVLVADEVGSGLIPRDVAELRLQEEVDRARLFRRPLGLLLVEITPHQDQQNKPKDLREVDRAITRQLANASLLLDIPFRLDADCVGLIMPERTWEQLNEDADGIIEAINDTSLIDEEGNTRSALRFVGLHYGLGTYQGEPEKEQKVDLLRAARDSLSISHDLAVIGSSQVYAFALPAAPVVVDGTGITR